MAATVKVALRFKTPGAKRGDVIEVSAVEADRLVANGTARRVAPPKVDPKKSDKD